MPCSIVSQKLGKQGHLLNEFLHSIGRWLLSGISLRAIGLLSLEADLGQEVEGLTPRLALCVSISASTELQLNSVVGRGYMATDTTSTYKTLKYLNTQLTK